MRMRTHLSTTTAGLLAAWLTTAAGCGVSIPEGFEEIVPKDGRDKIELATETSGASFGADKLLLLAYAEGTDLQARHEGFRTSLEGAGYTLVGTCKTDSGGIGSQDFIKAPAKHVQVFSRTDTMLNVLRAAKLMQLDMSPEPCSFTDAAAELCATLEGDVCTLPK